MHGHGELCRPAGDVVVQAAAPAVFVTGGSFLEGSDVAVRWHTGSLAGGPATEEVTWPAAPGIQTGGSIAPAADPERQTAQVCAVLSQPVSIRAGAPSGGQGRRAGR